MIGREQMRKNEISTSPDSEKGDGRERPLFQPTGPFLGLDNLISPSILWLSLYSSNLNLTFLLKQIQFRILILVTALNNKGKKLLSSSLERRGQARKMGQRQNWKNRVTNLMSHVSEGVSKGKSQAVGLRDWREMVMSLAEVDNSEDKLYGA